jgi:hypothetical protein
LTGYQTGQAGKHTMCDAGQKKALSIQKYTETIDAFQMSTSNKLL